MKSNGRNTWLLLILLLVGLVIGGVIGDMFKGILPVLGYSKTIGVDTFTVDLSVIKLTLGLKMNINLAGIIGLFISIFTFSKL